ncbi:unnamed protein product [Hermetia illucens]|uniref:Ig-like domain-containing protein n=1 Tax=Hermetia illucens TaxID=343691 RepID=A0A7R8UNY5_HERIL|nr:unnamed protein product [Hermetia illucens]
MRIIFVALRIVGLRLIKVVIPAYKLRGESALLECQYELNRSQSIISSNSNNNGGRGYGSSISGRGGYGMGTNDGGGMNGYISGSNGGVGSMTSNGNYRRIRNHQHQHYHYHDQYKNPNQDEIRSSSRGYHYGGSGPSSYSAYDSDEQREEGEALYSVKWYKDNEEFYRFVPKVNPPQQSYKVDGIRVDHQYSDSTRVLLRGLTLRSTGVYKCEVSAEAPNFSSVQGEGRMDIVFLPRDGPHISGKEDQYQIGDILGLNCTSGKSHPASQLQWFINDEPVNPIIINSVSFRSSESEQSHFIGCR